MLKPRPTASRLYEKLLQAMNKARDDKCEAEFTSTKARALEELWMETATAKIQRLERGNADEAARASYWQQAAAKAKEQTREAMCT